MSTDSDPPAVLPRKYELAAAAGNHAAAAAAAARLSECFHLGEGVLRNAEKGMEWYLRAWNHVRQAGRPGDEGNLRVRLKEWVAEGRDRDERTAAAAKALAAAESEDSVSAAMAELRVLSGKGFAPAVAIWAAEVLEMRSRNLLAEARAALREAVRQGHPDSLALAGWWLLTGGLGVRQDIPRARELIARAAVAGSAAAFVQQGVCALRGLGETPDPKKAGRLFGQGCKAGDPRGWFERAAPPAGADGTAQVGFLRNAAEAGDVRACLRLGFLYRDGRSGVPENREEAKALFRRAAIRGRARGMFEFARVLLAEGSRKEAVHWLDRALGAGSPDAGVQLGLLRLEGVPEAGLSRNWREAEALLRRHCRSAGDPLRLDETALRHFIAKPAEFRTERDRRFLDWAKAELAATNPRLGATAFRDEDPAFAAGCGASAGPAEEESRRPPEPEREPETGREPDRRLWKRVGEILGRPFQTKDERLLVGDLAVRAARPYWSRKPGTESGAVPPFVRVLSDFVWRNAATHGIDPRVADRACRFEAEAGSRDALREMASNDPERWLERAAAAKIPEALRFRAVRVLEDPASGERERREARRDLLEAAEAGDPDAQWRIGRDLAGRDEDQAADWFLKAAERSHPEALFEVACRCRDGNGLPRDERTAEHYFEDAAGVDGNGSGASDVAGPALRELGKLRLRRGAPQDAVRPLRDAAGRNDAEAAEILGCDPSLRGIVGPDEALKYCEMAADRRRPRAEVRLGRIRLAESAAAWARIRKPGERTPSEDMRDWFDLPYQLFLSAAEAGYGPGAYELARLLLFGDGREPDRKEAAAWFAEAERLCGGASAEERGMAAAARAWLATSLFD